MDLPIPPELAVEKPPFPVEVLDSSLEEPRWRIESDGEAEWSLRHLAEAKMAVSTVEEQAAEWHRRIDDYVARATAPLRRRIDFFEAHLEDYGQRVRLASGDEIKTIKLPSGDVVTRQNPPKIKIGNPDLWQSWAAAHADTPLVRVKYELNAAEAKAAFMVTSEAAAIRWTFVLSCGAVVDELVPAGDLDPEWGLDLPCPECGPAGIRERCAVADVMQEAIVRHTVRDRDTGYPVEWAEVEPGSVSAKVKL